MPERSTLDADDRVDAGAELVEAIRAGDEMAFAGIVHLWSPFLLRTATLLTGDPGGAETLVRETWLRVLRELSAFRPPPRLRAMVCGVMLRAADVTVPAGGSQDEPTVDPGRFLPPDDPRWPGHWAVPPGDWPAMEDLRAGSRGVGHLLREALAELPVEQRVVVGLRDMAGCDVAEISEIVRRDHDDVRRLLHHGRSVLRRRLETHFLAPTA